MPSFKRIVLICALFAAFSVASPNFASAGNVYSLLEASAILGIVAAGLGVTMLAGEFDLSIGSIAACAGLIAIMMSNHGIVTAVVCAVIPALIYGIAQGFAIARLQISSLVFTLGTFIGMRGVAYIVSNEKTLTLAMTNLKLASMLRERILIFSPFSILMIAVLIAVGLFLRYTRYGREIYAIGGARKESQAAGVPQTRPLAIAFACSASLAALAGALAALRGGSATPGSHETLLLSAVAAALIGGVSVYGGRGNMLGVFLGVLTLQILLSGLQMLGTPNWTANLATGIVLLAFLTVDLTNGKTPIATGLHRLKIRRNSRISPAGSAEA
ncbi:ABC transporter permease (plasmid) [Rhizobium sp. AB2/73]|nr:ABC transporter permease [Agrobacterium sp. S7/73]QYA17341.1 ABC transporter permease [Rhizobium sp. AB2/73]UEQ85666.1 ABC transporter permease [Rhizobium sp. AB2/73]